MKSRRDAILPHIDNKLKTQLRIFSVIALIMLGVIVYDVIDKRLPLVIAVLAVLTGVVIGMVLSRMYKLSWHEDNRAVVSRIDWIGAIILLAYIVFSLLCSRLIGLWVQNASEVAAVGLAISAGIMLGRVLGLRLGIRRLLGIWVPGLFEKTPEPIENQSQ